MINEVTLIGNLGQEPVIRTFTTPNGEGQVANMSLATTLKFGGNSQTEWHRIVVFGNLVPAIQEHYHKGRQVYVKGRLQTRKYTDKQGIERYITEIIAQTTRLLGPHPGTQAPADAYYDAYAQGDFNPDADTPADAPQAQAPAKAQPAQTPPAPPIPF